MERLKLETPIKGNLCLSGNLIIGAEFDEKIDGYYLDEQITCYDVILYASKESIVDDDDVYIDGDLYVKDDITIFMEN